MRIRTVPVMVKPEETRKKVAIVAAVKNLTAWREEEVEL